MMGGTIEFESEYGKGSVFTIYLPLVPGDHEKIKKIKTFERIMAIENIPVLVVDDNPVNLTVALGFLQTHNIKAETASSGQEALRMIEEKAGTYDLVFMDHMMPEMDGLETTKRIREWEEKKQTSKAKIPIVALSANAIAGVEKIFLQNGMNDFISKPIIADELNRVLGQWLPRDKVRVGAVSYSGDSAGKTNDPLLEELSRIGGLEVQTGLSHVGQNRETYYTALRQFADNCDSYLEDLGATLKAGDWKNYAIRAHALKGVLAAFGAGRLSQWAGNLEKASKEGSEFSPALCKEETAPFSAALSKFQTALHETSLFAVSDVDKKEKPKGDEKFLREQIPLLIEACNKFSSENAEKIIASLLEYDWENETNAKLEKIRALVAGYDFEKVACIIE
jgi:CheY-like chemotaxis protein